MCVSSFLERHFCCAKVIACGRMIEREWGNPQRFPPHTPPSLRYAGVRTTKPVGDHKKKHHPSGWCFFFGMSRAGWSLLPRLARSAQAKTPPFRAAFLSAAAAAYPCQYRPGDNSWFTARGACCSMPDRRCSAGRQRHRAPRLCPRSWGWCCCRRW